MVRGHPSTVMIDFGGLFGFAYVSCCRSYVGCRLA